jgi:hypothetical protein
VGVLYCVLMDVFWCYCGRGAGTEGVEGGGSFWLCVHMLLCVVVFNLVKGGWDRRGGGKAWLHFQGSHVLWVVSSYLLRHA